MSSGELLLTFIVALIVFGPQKLPMLAYHLGLLIRKFHYLKDHMSTFWQQQLNQQQFEENQQKAAKADEEYKQAEISTYHHL